jgi:hypothetical protein
VCVPVPMLVFLAVGCIGSSTAPTTSPQSAAPTPLSGGTTGICGSASPRLVNLPGAGVGLVLGRSPVWAGVYADYDARRGAYRAQSDAPRTEFGTRIKVLWVVTSSTPPVTITWGSANGHSISFALASNDTPTRVLSLDPRHPLTSSGGPSYGEFPSYIYVPRSGCYTLTVRPADSGDGRRPSASIYEPTPRSIREWRCRAVVSYSHRGVLQRFGRCRTVRC